MVLPLLLSLCRPAHAGELVTQWINVADGLPSNWTSSVMQDDAGFIWVGGPGSISRYDGSQVRSWSTPTGSHEPVGELVSFADGSVVAVQYDGRVSRLDREGIEVMTGPDGLPLRADDLARGASEELLVAREGALWSWQADGGWTHLLDSVAGEDIKLVEPGADEELILGTTSSWVRRTGDGALTVFETEGRPQQAAARGDALWLSTGAPARLWLVRGDDTELVYESISTKAQGLMALSGEAWFDVGLELVRVPLEGGVEPLVFDAGRQVQGPLIEGSSGEVWLTGFEGLALILHPGLQRWSTATGLATNATRFPTRWQGELWLGTWRGIHRFGEDLDPVLATDRVGKGRVCAGRNLWTQVSTFDEGEWLAWDETGGPWRHPAPGYAFVLGCDVDTEGTVWLLSQETLFRADDPRVAPEPVGQVPLVPGGSMRAVAIGASGEIWVGANHRVCGSDPARLERDPGDWTCAELSGTRRLSALHITERGSPWVVSRTEGLLEVSGTEVRPVPGAQALPVRDIRNVESSPRGGQWVVGLGAAVRVLDEAEGLRVVEVLPEWVGQTISAVEGLHEDADGTLWLASNTGLIRVDVDLRSGQSAPPRPRLVQVQVDGVAVDGSSEITVPSGAAVSLELAALAYRAPGLVRFRHRLGGVRWSAPTRQAGLELAALKGGPQLLEVQASLDGENWSEDAVELVLFVDLPWWRRASSWGFGLAGLAVMLLVGQGVRHRLRSRAEQLRTRVAMDLHDELGAGLASMGLLAGLIGQGGDARALAGRIAKDAQELGANLSGIVWSLRPGHDTLGALLDYVEHRARAVLPHLGDEDLAVLRSPTQDAEPLDLDVVRAVQLVCLEALHNISKHAEARRVWVRVERAGSRLRLVLEDDGVGLDAGSGVLAPDRGLGLQSMASRMAEIDGELELSSGPEGGTRVMLSFRPRRSWWRLRSDSRKT